MSDSVLRVRLQGDARQLNASLKTASTRLQAFGAKAKAISGQLRSMSIPLALVGGAAVKMGLDFDRSMTRIKSLVGIAGDEVDAMGKSARQMALGTARSSSEAAEALFFVTSAGLRGAEAMQVLNASLKASAVGLGETKVVADLATSAMNAYGSANLSATDATDIMVAAVREGKLEANELAGSMGRVLPVASAMGVQFNDVGAAFAALSRTGTNAAEAATQIRGIFKSILSPTKDAKDMLADLGLSTQGLRQQLEKEGLLSMLETLKTSFAGNSEATQTVFGNIRALSAIMDLLGSNVDTTRAIFDRMTDSTGMAQKAFDEYQNSISGKFEIKLNQAREAFADLGQIIMVELLPVVKNLGNFLKGLSTAFGDLDKKTQNIILSLGGILIISPLIVSAIGTIATALGALLSPIGLIIAGVVALGYAIYKNWESIAPIVVDIANKFIDWYNEIQFVREGVEAIRLAFVVSWEYIKGFFRAIFDNTEKTGNVFKSLGKVIANAFSPTGLSMALAELTMSLGQTTYEAVDNALKRFETNIDMRKKIEPLDIQSLENYFSAMGDKAKALWEQIKQYFTFPDPEIPDFGTGATGNGTGGDNNEAMGETLTLAQKMAQSFENLEFSATAAFTAIGEGLTSAFEAMLSGESFFKTFGKFLKDMIKRLIAAAMAAAILSTLLGGGAAVKSANFKGMFAAFSGFGQQKATAFASGGIVSTPTLGLVGEYAGARQNPEVIAPLDKLQSMIGDRGGNVNVTGEFKLQGQDLVVALERAGNNRNRNT